eukprot:TRINITY_DN15387_c0_g1_i1.p1 TRINITY_DN15387_c0_g1~~TRINITY_DN15387_c0_g1_i1.p1  ORF type:complete len:250 (+),score=49.91 TRINITY_DN15387_c0_g1_i1:106-855(+)
MSDGGGEAEEQADLDDEIAGLLNKREKNFPLAAAVLSLLLLLPASAMLFQGIQGQSTCGQSHTACYEHCDLVWSRADRTFMSSIQGERDCYAACDDVQIECRATAANSLVGALFMCIGLYCTFCLIGVVETVMMGNTADKSSDPHPHVDEPIKTEEQKRKEAIKGRERWIKRVGRCFCCCPRFVKNKVFNKLLAWRIVPEKQTEWTLIEVKCPRCDVPFEIDGRWRTAERSGMEGCVCPICLNRILGLL